MCSFSYTLTFQTPEQEPEKTYCCLWPKYFQKTIFEKPVGKATVCSFAKLYFSNSGKRTGKSLFMIFSKTIFGEATVCSFCKTLLFKLRKNNRKKPIYDIFKDYFWRSYSVQFLQTILFKLRNRNRKKLIVFFERLFLRNRLAKLQCAVLQNSTFQTPEKEPEKAYL